MNNEDREFMLVLVPILKNHLRRNDDDEFALKYIDKFIHHYRIFIDASYYGEKNIANDLDKNYEFLITLDEIEKKYRLRIPTSFKKMYPA